MWAVLAIVELNTVAVAKDDDASMNDDGTLPLIAAMYGIFYIPFLVPEELFL